MPRLYVESDEQISLFKSLCAVPYRGLTLRDFVYAVPNGGTRGGRRAIMQAARRVAEGLTSGVPDIECPVAVAPYTGLHIEMKRPKADGGRPSDIKKEQRVWITRLRELGRKVEVAYGAQEAMDILLQYLGVTGRSNSTSRPSISGKP